MIIFCKPLALYICIIVEGGGGGSLGKGGDLAVNDIRGNAEGVEGAMSLCSQRPGPGSYE